ncbi:hypothetical protein RNZ50_25360 [Paracoccaceae bacterium Fryx2]|nr:hypothetical protein [Paracoccaceae bacterium Fryx2]MDT8858278.1 hypothetical protein [Paracoccaceae bacterium Fryx2]MDT8858293.1 hypothetical protein [Paracoccaceae bacterium Fryx2]
MIELNLSNGPKWLDLIAGLRLQLRPLTTSLMVAARADPAIQDLATGASDDERAVAFAKALARLAILDWEGVGDADGVPLAPSEAAIDALLDLWPVFEAFQTQYVAKGLLIDAEKNGFAPLPSGPSAGVTPIAPPVSKTASTAPAA